MSQLTLHEYQHLAMRTAKEDLSMRDHLAHAGLGVASDGGEFASLVKMHLIYGVDLHTSIEKDGKRKPLIEHMFEELGDTLWFIQYAAKHLGCSLEEIAKMNLEKLRKRYPGRYTDSLAIERLDKK